MAISKIKSDSIDSIAATKLTGTVDNARIALSTAEVPNLDASKITTGTVNNARITLDAAEIPNISTDKLTTGTLPDARIAALAASKLTGTIADARFPATLPATSGANLTALPAANITGVIPAANLGTGTASSSTFLNGSGAYSAAGGGDFIRLGGAAFSGVTAVTIAPSGFDMDYAVSSGYDAYKLFFTFDNVNASERPYVYVAENGGSSFDHDTNNVYNYVGTGMEGTTTWGSAEYSVGAFWIGGVDITSSNHADAIWHVELTMIKPLAEAKSFAAHCIFGYYEGGSGNGDMNGGDMAWIADGMDNVDAIELTTNGGNNLHGYWTMYGMKS